MNNTAVKVFRQQEAKPRFSSNLQIYKFELKSVYSESFILLHMVTSKCSSPKTSNSSKDPNLETTGTFWRGMQNCWAATLYWQHSSSAPPRACCVLVIAARTSRNSFQQFIGKNVPELWIQVPYKISLSLHYSVKMQCLKSNSASGTHRDLSLQNKGCDKKGALC